jgi:hypothetical protein
MNIKKGEKFAYGIKRFGEISNDKEMVREANEILYKSKLLKKQMWFNRKKAKAYNDECMKRGF